PLAGAGNEMDCDPHLDSIAPRKAAMTTSTSRTTNRPRAWRPFVLGLLFAVAFLTRPGAAQAPPTQTLTFLSVADVHVDASAATTNFKTDTQLKVDGSPVNIAYLRFTVSGVNGRAV